MIKLKYFPIMDESFLRKVAEPVKDAVEADDIYTKLFDNFPNEGAFAIAAPQIGIGKRAFLARLKGEWIFVCNPEIVEREEPTVFFNEGCLSFPGKRKDTKRYNRVKVKYMDLMTQEGTLILEETTVVLEGVEAVVFQHEIDHLNGVLYMDHGQDYTIRNAEPKIGRNEPCPCNSGKKYKKCHGE